MTPKRLPKPGSAAPLVPQLVPQLPHQAAEPGCGAAEPVQSGSIIGDSGLFKIDGSTPLVPQVPQLSTKDGAALANVSERAIRKAIATGRLEATPVLVADGMRAGRTDYQFSSEALFLVYPDARRAWEARRRQAADLAAMAAAQAAPAIAPPQEPRSIQDMKDWQRRRMDARVGILHYLNRMARENGLSAERAVARLVAMADEKRLPDDIQRLIPLANARSGQSGDRTLSRRTLQRWAKEAREGLDRLAPKATDRAMPSWLPQLLAIYRQPQKPSLSWAVQNLVSQLPEGAKAPSYDSARRWLDKVGALERERGRMLDREIKAIKPFRRREKPDFPMDILTADGHTFDAEIAHPEHGRPFRPELTMVVDVATNRIVGWSAWEKESSWSVMDAFRMAVLRGGVPLIFYTDNGPGYRNERMEALQARLGFDHRFSIPYNSQARGVIEHMQKTVWVDLAAKAFSTYVGAAMDRQARQIVFKASRKGVPVLPSWQAFVAFVDQVVAAHNARPSRACPKALDAETGRQRHLSPDATWAQAEALGWKPEGLPISLDDFRPEEMRMVRRGEISLFGNTYFSRELAELHGEEVRVAFDIHDASRVWVSRQDGTFVCEAGFEANKSAYFPKPYVESLREKRQEGQRQRLEAKSRRVLGDPQDRVEVKDLTEAERTLAAEAFMMLPHFSPEPLPEDEPRPQAVTPSGRPIFRDDIEYYRWALAHPEALDDQEAGEIHLRIQSDPALQAVLGLGA